MPFPKKVPATPALNTRQVLELRKRVREGDLRNTSLRSIAYQQKTHIEELRDALIGRGLYQNYPHEGVIDREKYASFYDGYMSFNAIETLQKARDRANNAGLEYKVDKHLIVEEVKPLSKPASLPTEEKPVEEPEPVDTSISIALAEAAAQQANKGVEISKRTGRPKQAPRGKGKSPDQKVIDSIRHLMATRPDMSARNIASALGIVPETVIRITYAKDNWKGKIEGLPVRPNWFPAMPMQYAPSSVEEYKSIFGRANPPATLNEYIYFMTNRKAAETREEQSEVEEIEKVEEPKMVALPSVGPVEKRQEGPIPEETPKSTILPERSFPHKLETSPAEALIMQMLQAVGPEKLGWKKLPEGKSGSQILRELTTALELAVDATKELTEWFSALEGEDAIG